MSFDDYARDHLRQLRRFAVVLTGDPVTADDVLQTALLKAYQHWSKVQAADHPHAYVRRMITNEYLSWRRKWARQIAISSSTD